MARHLPFGHAEMAGHGAGAEILEAAGAPGRRRARQRKAKHCARIACILVSIIASQFLSS
jgi:hypothetical protein